MKPRIDFYSLDGVIKDVVAHEQRLRALIEKHGGVSAWHRRPVFRSLQITPSLHGHGRRSACHGREAVAVAALMPGAQPASLTGQRCEEERVAGAPVFRDSKTNEGVSEILCK